MSFSKPTVLVIGSSGRTGYPVTTALLDTGRFNIILLCRPGSEEKRQVKELMQKGAELRVGDIVENSVEDLEGLLVGVNILVIMVATTVVGSQENILLAASKSKDIERVVPSEFSAIHSETNPIVNSSTTFQNQLKTRSIVKELNLPYTYINIGWWMNIVLPHVSHEPPQSVIGPGNVKTAVTSKTDIGRFVARIIDDPRTLNAQVFCYGDEISLEEAYDIAERNSGDAPQRIIFSNEEFWDELLKAQRDYQQSPSPLTLGIETFREAWHVAFIDGENTAAMAKKLGYLDARELYPDFKPQSAEEFAKEFYK